MSDMEYIDDEIGAGQPMAISVTHNEAMDAWDVNVFVGGCESEEFALKVADLLKDILITDGFAARLDRIQ